MLRKQNDSGSRGPLLTVLGESARLEGKFNIGESILIECEVAGEMYVVG